MTLTMERMRRARNRTMRDERGASTAEYAITVLATVVEKKRTLTASHPSRTSRWPAHHVRAPDDTANPATFRTALPSRALGVAHA